MNWYKTDTGLKDHLKLRRLAKKLSINEVQALGHYHLLFSYTAEYAETGDLKTISPEELEVFCGWNGAANLFVDALLELKILDRKPDGTFRAHGFYEANTRHLKDIARKRRDRNGRGQGAPEARTGRGQGALPTNLPNHTNQTNETAPSAFDRFWMVCTNKVGKIPAKKAWDKLEAMEKNKAIEIWPLYVKDCEIKKTSLKNPQGWLNDKRFNDQLDTIKQEPLKGAPACKAYGHQGWAPVRDRNDEGKLKLQCSRCLTWGKEVPE